MVHLLHRLYRVHAPATNTIKRPNLTSLTPFFKGSDVPMEVGNAKPPRVGGLVQR